MHTPSSNPRTTPGRADAVERLLAQGMPLCQIEELLDQWDYEEACAARMPRMTASLIDQLLWS